MGSHYNYRDWRGSLLFLGKKEKMSLKDDFFIVLRNISNRKLRSWLTVLGVVIGVAAIIALTSVSRSLELSIQQEFETFGTDKIYIYPKGGIPGYGTGLNTD